MKINQFEDIKSNINDYDLIILEGADGTGKTSFGFYQLYKPQRIEILYKSFKPACIEDDVREVDNIIQLLKNKKRLCLDRCNYFSDWVYRQIDGKESFVVKKRWEWLFSNYKTLCLLFTYNFGMEMNKERKTVEQFDLAINNIEPIRYLYQSNEFYNICKANNITIEHVPTENKSREYMKWSKHKK